MPARKRSVLYAAAVTILALVIAGCGGGRSNPTPQGGFTNASLNGSYAFLFTGNDAKGFFAVAGNLTADGNGHITSGALDINKVGGVSSNVALTGSYAIRPDGRGVATLNSSAGNISLVFVIISSQHVLLTRFENSASGSGTLDMVNPSAFSTTALAGTFVFSLAGVDTLSNPFATVGSMTFNSAGTVTSGVQDSSDNGVILGNQPISAGTITVAPSGRGTAVITTTAGTLNFAFYIVDANQIKLVQTDAAEALAGDGFRQTGTISNASLSGPFAFTIAGADIANGPYAAGGVLASDGAGAITSGTADENDAGLVRTNLPLTGTYLLDASGRGTATLSNATLGTLNFAAYPTVRGVQLLETDTGFVVLGAALPQTGAFANTTLQGDYALNYTGVTTTGPLDAVAEFIASGAGNLNGIIDINNAGSLSTGTALSGTYSIGASGRGPLAFASPLGQQNMAIYVVDNTRALFLEVDTNVVLVGVMQHR